MDENLEFIVILRFKIVISKISKLLIYSLTKIVICLF